jgi:hypothetical protein
MQPCNRIYYSKIYWRFNMFRVAYRSSSGAPNYICSLWFIYTCGDGPLSRLVTTCVYKPEAANTVWSPWWWAVCRSKHVEPSINFGIINSITRLHLVGYFYWFTLLCTDQWILNLGTTCLMSQCNKPEGLNPQIQWYENLRSHRVRNEFWGWTTNNLFHYLHMKYCHFVFSDI